MTSGPSALPTDLTAALAALRAEREARHKVEVELGLARMQASDLRAEAANPENSLRVGGCSASR